MVNEADTCRMYVRPRLKDAGWETEPHSYTEQHSFTAGRIVVVGRSVRRREQKRADFLLRYTRDIGIAVVEAKAEYRLQAETSAELDALLPSVLDRAFRGEL